MKRLATALVLIPAVSWAILLAPFPVFFAVVALFAGLCYYEYGGIVAAHGLPPLRVAGFAAGAIILVPLPHLSTYLPVVLAMMGLVLALRVLNLEQALAAAGAFLLGVYYVFGAWASAIGLHTVSPHWLFFAVAINWVGDGSAYYVGKAFGRHKMAPRISPSKSWEGAAASLAGAMVFAGVYLHFALPAVPAWQAVLMGAAANAAGQLGDLTESALKRGAGLKDSGSMVPGHGGWLDRLDSSLFSMPVVYALLQLR